MNIFNEFERRITAALAAMAADGELPQGLDLSRVVCEPPRDRSHGDISTNAAMVLAKEARMPPRALAEKIAPQPPFARCRQGRGRGTGLHQSFARALRLRAKCLRASLAQGSRFGASASGAGAKVNVEYVSANPTGPMHVGHGRGAVVGDAIASLLAFTGP